MPGDIRILFRSDDQSPLGQIADAAFVQNSTGVPAHRILGRYALIFLTDGNGVYEDANHKATPVSTGDLFILFPDIAHRYGPFRRGRWEEFYISFYGPVFDLWRSSGVLTPRRPLFRLGHVTPWLDRLTRVVDVPADTPSPGGDIRAGGPSEHQLVMVSRLQSVLAEILASQAISLVSNVQLWLTEACHWLEIELGEEMDCHWVAQKVGLSYDRFRKKFSQEMGMTPYQYRSAQRLRAAEKMLTDTEMSLKEIAASVGFYDEFAFSNRFKHATGVSPRTFRQQRATLGPSHAIPSDSAKPTEEG